MGGRGGGGPPVPGLSGGRGGLPPCPPRGGSRPGRRIGEGAAEDLMLLPPMLRAEGGGGGRGPKEVGRKKGKSVNLCTHRPTYTQKHTLHYSPVRTDDWFLPRAGGLSFGGGGRGPVRPCGVLGPWLAKRFQMLICIFYGRSMRRTSASICPQENLTC